MGPEPQSIDISLSGGVTIVWTDGHVSRYSIRRLREACPCASCHEKHEPAPAAPANPLPIYTPTGSTLQKVEPVGRYALQFFFSDRHNTGIYTWEYLRELCDCEACTRAR